MGGETFGPYRLQRMIGRGGMGEVYEAYDTVQDRQVAVKRLLPHMADDADFQKRFRRESRLAARLRNPHVVPIHTYGDIDGRLFLEMRLVEGRDLHQVLAEEGHLAPERAVAVIGQVASALSAAHRDGLVHRDVKPSNVLLDHDGDDFVYLADFGITRAVSGASQSITASHVVVGSLDYMAPEQYDGEAGPPADVYSLGCLLFQCLTGSPPFRVEGLPALMKAHTTVEPPRPSERCPELGTAFDDVVVRAMAKDPAARPEGAVELAVAARAALARTAAPDRRTLPRPVPDRAGEAPGTPGGTTPGLPTTIGAPAAGGSAPSGTGPTASGPPTPPPGSGTPQSGSGTPPSGSGTLPPGSGTPSPGVGAPPSEAATAVLSRSGAGGPPGAGANGQGPPPEPPQAPPGRAGGPARRRVTRAGVLAAVVVLVVCAGVGALVGTATNRSSASPVVSPGVAAPVLPPGVTSTDRPTIAARFAVPGGPETVAISPDGGTAYMTTTEDQPALAVLDVRTGRVTASVPTVGPPYFVGLSPSGDRAYVSMYDRAQQEVVLGVFDTRTNTFTGSIPTGQRAAQGTRLTWVFGFAVSRDGTRIYVPNQEASVVSVLDAVTARPITQIPVPATPHWVTLTPDGRYAYVANHMPGQLTVIDTATNRVAGAVPIGAGVATHSVAVSPDGRIAESVNYDADVVTMVDTATNRVLATIPVGEDPQAVVFAPDGLHSYVVNEDAGTVSVINTARRAVVAALPIGDGVSMIAIAPDGRTALVTQKEGRSVAVVTIAA